MRWLSARARGACGPILQTVFRNSLADPFILEVVFGARFGVALLVVITGTAGNALLFNCGLFGDFAMAVASALGTVLVLGLLLTLSRRVSTVTLLVAEPVLGCLFTGLISVVKHFVDESQARAFASCSDRSLAGATFPAASRLLSLGGGRARVGLAAGEAAQLVAARRDINAVAGPERRAYPPFRVPRSSEAAHRRKTWFPRYWTSSAAFPVRVRLRCCVPCTSSDSS